MNIDGGLQISDLGGVLRRRAKAVAATALGVLLLVYWIAMALPNVYTSYATVLVEPQAVVRGPGQGRRRPERHQPAFAFDDRADPRASAHVADHRRARPVQGRVGVPAPRGADRPDAQGRAGRAGGARARAAPGARARRSDQRVPDPVRQLRCVRRPRRRPASRERLHRDPHQRARAAVAEEPRFHRGRARAPLETRARSGDPDRAGEGRQLRHASRGARREPAPARARAQRARRRAAQLRRGAGRQAVLRQPARDREGDGREQRRRQPGAPARAAQARALRIACARLHRQAPGRDSRARGDRAAREEGQGRRGRGFGADEPDGAAALGTGAPRRRCAPAPRRARSSACPRSPKSSRPSSTRRPRSRSSSTGSRSSTSTCSIRSRTSPSATTKPPCRRSSSAVSSASSSASWKPRSRRPSRARRTAR